MDYHFNLIQASHVTTSLKIKFSTPFLREEIIS